MRLLTSTIPNDCEIVLHGDNHEGLLASHTAGTKKLVKWIMAEKNRFFCHLGDAIEARPTHHKYVDIRDVGEGLPFKQAKNVKKLYRPARTRCLVWMEGNHEYALQRYGDIVEDIICGDPSDPEVDGLGVPFGGSACKLRLLNSTGRQICKIYMLHPNRFTLNSNAKDEEQRRANMHARLKWFLQRKAADCLIMAVPHTHKLLVVPPNRLLLMTDDGRRMKQQYLEAGDGAAKYIEPNRRWYVNTGCGLKTAMVGHETYSEKAGYDPVELGYIVVTIKGGKVVDVRDAIA